MPNPNHPKLGDSTKADPIRNPKDIKLIKKMLGDNPRNLALFVTNVNFGLRAIDCLNLTVGQLKYLKVGEEVTVRERKTKKDKRITLNRSVHDAVQNLLATMPDAKDHEPLFQSRKGGKALSVPYFSGLVKQWCRDANLKGRYSSHSCRKTTGFQLRVTHGIDIPTLMVMFNHSCQSQTLTYLGIQASEIRDAYMLEI